MYAQLDQRSRKLREQVKSMEKVKKKLSKSKRKELKGLQINYKNKLMKINPQIITR